MIKYYDVIVNNNRNNCEKLYLSLLKAGCRGLDIEVCFLRDAVVTGSEHYLRYAYRISIENGKIYYYGFRNINEVTSTSSISLTDFINIIQPERTVII